VEAIPLVQERNLKSFWSKGSRLRELRSLALICPSDPTCLSQIYGFLYEPSGGEEHFAK